MKSAFLRLLASVLVLISGVSLQAQSDQQAIWTEGADIQLIEPAHRLFGMLPTTYLLLDLDHPRLEAYLSRGIDGSTPVSLPLPTPSGTYVTYLLEPSNVIAPEVSQYYSVKTFKGHSATNPNAIIRCSISASGFSAFVFDGDRSYAIEYIDKSSKTKHIIYYKAEADSPILKCGHKGSTSVDRRTGSRTSSPTSLRTFRLAYVSAGEFSQQWGGATYNSANVLNTIATGLNLLNAVYERDLGVTFVSVTPPALIYPDPATDPFTFANPFALIATNHTVCVNTLGSASFDLGHLLVWANTGGLATDGVCDAGFKGEGFSGSNFSLNNIFVDYSAHEIGHQFNAKHNFVSQECTQSVSGFRYEPGEGSSIMSYAGVCGGAASYQTESDPFFHSASINTMNAYINSTATCYSSSLPGSGNPAAPIPTAGADLTIPRLTPFVLAGSVTDANDGNITTLWEQNDGAGSAATGPPSCASIDQPLFRYQDPSTDHYRTFPAMTDILAGNNNSSTWDKLPCVARSINFNFVARDNNSNWGRTAADQLLVTVASTGPFAVLSPNGGNVWNEGSTETVTWSENGTAQHCPTVDILLSTDDGQSFATIVSATPNDGSHAVTVPNGTSSSARILVQCSTGAAYNAASTFFDVSDASFSIDMTLPVDLIAFDVKHHPVGQARLSWSTASEINSSHFDVERSSGCKEFEQIGSVAAQGYSSSPKAYDYIDEAPMQGVNCYRLAQTDIDGTIAYSDTKSLRLNNSASKYIVYPVPASDHLVIKGINRQTATTICIYDQLGRLAQCGLVTGETVDIRDLDQGIYYLTITSEQETVVEKIVISR